MEKAGCGIKQITIIIRFIEEITIIGFIPNFFGNLSQAPFVIGSAECNGDRLTFFERMNFGKGFFFALLQSRNIAVFVIKPIEFAGGFCRPGRQCFFHDGIARCRVYFFQIDIWHALSISIEDGCNPVIGIHETRIARNLRKCWPPKIGHLFGHAQKRANNITFGLGVDEHTQGMSSPICVPYPIVGKERNALVVVHFTIESTEITAILRNANRSLVNSVQRSIEHHLIVVRTTIHLNLAQCIVPDFSTFFGNSRQIEIGDFAI